MEGKGGSKISRKTAFYREIEAAFLGKRIFYNVFISRVSLERVRRQDGVALRDGLREYQAPFGRDVAERPPAQRIRSLLAQAYQRARRLRRVKSWSLLVSGLKRECGVAHKNTAAGLGQG